MGVNYFHKLVKQSSLYFTSTILVTIVSLVSFPIWTRIFTTAEYGAMSLATTSLSLLLIFSKMGIQHAVLRFYYEFKNNKRNFDISYLHSTALFAIFIFSLLISILFLITFELFFKGAVQPNYLAIMGILPLLIIFGSISDIFLAFYRSDQNVKNYSILNIGIKCLRFGGSLFFVFVLRLGLTGFFLGWAIVDIVNSVALISMFYRQKKIKWHHISGPLIIDAIGYGLPLLGSELAFVLLATGDRYLLQLLMDTAAVGVYSACYNVVDYAVSFFYVPLRLAVMPIYMKIWEEKGEQETQQFLVKVQKYYFMVGIPIVFGMVGVGKELIEVLATSKYLAGYVIIPYVALGILIYNAHFIYGAGFYLIKKTTNLFLVNLGGIAINIISNILMIPILGLKGAAIATLVSYVVVAVLIMKLANGILRVNIELIQLAKATFAAGIMYVVINNLQLDDGLVLLLAKIAVGVIVYGLVIFCLDKNSRKLLVNTIYHQYYVKILSQ